MIMDLKQANVVDKVKTEPFSPESGHLNHAFSPFFFQTAFVIHRKEAS